MIMKIRLFFKNWSRFEICLAVLGPLSILAVGLIFKSDILTISAAITGVICAFLCAKGLVLGQFVGLIIVFLYSILSYKNGFYGEIIINLGIMLPMYIWGITEWIKHKNKETQTVEVNSIHPKEWLYVSLIAIVIFFCFYFLLKVFNTNELIISTLSVIDNLFALYLAARRSKYNFVSYMANDIILLILWGIPVINGNMLLLAFLINPLVNLINDIYGFVNWTKLQKKQNSNK